MCLVDDRVRERALAGDAGSFARLCEQHRARIWRIVASVADGAAAEDIAQDVVVRAFRCRSTYRGDAPFEAWLSRIAVNAAHDYRKSAWRRRVCSLGLLPAQPGEARDTCGEFVAREARRRVRQAVSDLPDRERSPIWLHYFEGFTVAELARLYSEPESTLRSRMRSGMARLSARLADLKTDGDAPDDIAGAAAAGGAP